MTIVLSGRKLSLRARYANITNVWTLDIFDVSGLEPVELVRGIAIVMGIDLLRPYPIQIGSIFAEASSDPRVDAGRGELGSRVKLVHYTEAEMESA